MAVWNILVKVSKILRQRVIDYIADAAENPSVRNANPADKIDHAANL